MASKGKLLILPCDGIGTEVMREVKRVIQWLARKRGVIFDIEDGLVGGAAYDASGVPLTDKTIAQAQAADAVLLGAVGGPKWDDLPFEVKPERGLLRLRQDLQLFANLRPAICFDALVDTSSLKPDLVRGLDILIVRELTGGVYFGQPRGIETLADGSRRGINTQVYTTEEIHRVARVAFDAAMKRDKRVTSVEKANVMESGMLWREEVTLIRDREFPEITLDHMYADNCVMQLIRRPTQFDVIVTDNLFGDILSDAAAMATGSLGMLPSASFGALDPVTAKRKAMYEPVHGSAPDIAGRDIANPIATILSFAMALRYSLDLGEEALLIEKAIEHVLAGGLRTVDILQPNTAKVSTSVMGEAIVRTMEKFNA